MNTPAQCGVVKPPKTDIYSEAPHNITHLGASLSTWCLPPDSRGPDPRTRTLKSEHLPHQPRRAGKPNWTLLNSITPR